MGEPDGDYGSETEAMRDDISSLRATVEQLKAELAWVKLTLGSLLGTTPKPGDSPAKTSPPWVTTASLLAVPVITAIIATRPWA